MNIIDKSKRSREANLGLLLGLLSLAAVTVPGSTDPVNTDLEHRFMNPPDDVKTGCYWYWVSDYISEEGIINDLKAMKSVGIERAYIGNIGLTDDGGDVKFGTEEWWHMLHTALKTATELNIELGLFNSPGWSQSGGPWVDSTQAMRYLASSSVHVEGGDLVTIELPKPNEDFQDVKVLAYPELNDGKIAIEKIVATPAIADAAKLIDGDATAGSALAKGEGNNQILDIVLAEESTVRSLSIFANNYSLNTTATFQVKQGDQYVNLSTFKLDRYNGELNVGFNPLAPVVISIPATSAKEFRLIVNNSSPSLGLAEIELSSVPTIERYPEKTLAKMYQQPLPYWHEYQWAAQPVVDDESLVVRSRDVLDITTCLNGDQLQWKAPAGNWTVMRIGATPTGTKNAPANAASTGWEVDKMNSEHIAAHFDAYMGEVLRRVPAEDRKTWKIVVLDSYEVGGQNYTDGLFEMFKKTYKYDPVPFLPTLYGVVVESQDASDRFLWDLRRLIADRIAHGYVAGLSQASRKYGMGTWLECYGHWGFPGEFLQYGGQSDEIAGEYWATGTLGDIENRAASSCGHIYNKSIVWAESFTSGDKPFSIYPAKLKQRGDRFFCEGINGTILHLYIHQPFEDRQPGVNAWFGTEFNRFNTWFSHTDLLVQYVERVDFMLRQGLNVADVAYFIGEDTPKMTGITDPPLPQGYQFDYINAEVLKVAKVKDGMLTLPHGTQYKLLVLPKLATMRPELLKVIQKLVRQGAVILGPAPSRSPSYQGYPEADELVADIATSMWRNATPIGKYGNGYVINGLDMKEALRFVNTTPDFSYPEKGVNVHFGHRTIANDEEGNYERDNLNKAKTLPAIKGREVYFLSNQENKPVTFNPIFRVKGRAPELWNPMTGEIRPLHSYYANLFGTTVPMHLEPYESVFVVFKKPSTGITPTDLDVNFPTSEAIQELDGPWNLRLLNVYRDINRDADLNTLQNLSENKDPEVKYFSGTMFYDTTFTFNAKENQGYDILLNLGEVNIMAKVKINDDYVGGVWTAPWKVNITNFLRDGENKVEIEVVNTWANRIIGDMQLPEKDRKIWMLANSWQATDPLPRSGLVGPVTLEKIKYDGTREEDGTIPQWWR